MKLVTAVIVGVIAAFGVGSIVGASGKSAVDLERRTLEEQSDLSEARALLLEGRVALFQSNFGDAAKHFDAARTIVERAQRRLRETSQPERAGRLEIALAQLKDAGRLAIALDPGAQNAAEQAIQAIRSVENPQNPQNP